MAFSLLLSHVEIEQPLLLLCRSLFIEAELVLEPLFTDHDTLLINDVVELAIIFFQDFILVVFLLFIIFLITAIQTCVLSIFLLVLVVELL